jgi:hypothetical protein
MPPWVCLSSNRPPPRPRVAIANEPHLRADPLPCGASDDPNRHPTRAPRGFAPARWDLFAELPDPYDVDQLARALIPDAAES